MTTNYETIIERATNYIAETRNGEWDAWRKIIRTAIDEALAEHVKCNAALSQELVEAREALAARGDAEPVWIQPDHLQKARKYPHLCRVAPTQQHPDFIPLYAAPPAKPQGERVLLYRYPRRVYNGWRVSNSERDTGPECEYRYATLDSEEA